MKTQLHQTTSAATLLIAPAPAAPGRLLRYLALITLVPVAYQHLLVTGWGLPSLPVTKAGVAMFVALFSTSWPQLLRRAGRL
jgi:hypothetical protein